jgi:hypothetical protein
MAETKTAEPIRKLFLDVSRPAHGSVDNFIPFFREMRKV